MAKFFQQLKIEDALRRTAAAVVAWSSAGDAMTSNTFTAGHELDEQDAKRLVDLRVRVKGAPNTEPGAQSGSSGRRVKLSIERASREWEETADRRRAVRA